MTRKDRTHSDRWPAPVAAGPLDAVVTLPGSKSVTNRALVIAALADGTSLLRRPLRSRDTELMVAGLRGLGVEIDSAGADWAVRGAPGALRPRADRVDLGNAGTVARFLPPVAALAVGRICFDGDPRIRDRPVGPLIVALRRLGSTVDDDGRGGFPLSVVGTGRLRGGAVTLDASSSSQLVSGLLLSGARCDAGVTVRHVGPALPSRPHVEMTVGMLRAAGARVDDGAVDTWTVWPAALTARDLVVEPDLSSAAAFLAAAAVTGGRVGIDGWPAGSSQPGAALPDLLATMGCEIDQQPDRLTVTGPVRLAGLDADLRAVGELTPVLAALCALATEPSRLTGVAHLRRHETDRLAALATEIGRLGGDVRELPDGLEIRPRPLHGGRFETYDDHRLAMAAAVLGLVVSGVEVVDVATTAKTVPGFVERWSRLLAGSGVPG